MSVGASLSRIERSAPSLRHLPGPTGAAFVRLMLHFVRDSLGALEASQAAYGDLVAFHWPVSTVIVYSPAAIRHVLVHNQANYEKGAQTEELTALMGAGLVTNNDRAIWPARRALIGRAIGASAIRANLSALTETIEDSLDQLDTPASSREVDVSVAMRRIAFRFACRIALGDAVSEVDARRIDDAVRVGARVVHRHMFSIVPLPYWLPLPSHLRLRYHRRALDQIIHRHIAEARRSAPGGDEHGVLGQLIHAAGESGALSDEELRDEVVTLLIAGYETTANALAWTLALLARHPAVQARVRREARSTAPVDLQALRSTHRYTGCVLHEALRLYPTIPMSSRRALGEDVLEGLRIPAGTNVVVPTWNMQRDPRSWDHPEAFCPARFESPESEATRTNCYAPFSRGERSCVGRTFALVEMASVVLRTVARFELRPASAPMPTPLSEVSLQPKEGVLLQVRRARR